MPIVSGAGRDSSEALSTVSVVIPAYNAVNTVGRALDSVLAQTYERIVEIIVVDDGSEDDTARYIRDNYPEATVLEQDNAGAAAARNAGVAEASGDYVAFLDDDDEWFAEKTQVQMMCFRECPGFRMTLTDMVVVENDGPGPGPPDNGEAASACRLLEPLTFERCFPTVPFHYGCSGWIFERSLFQECGGLEGVPGREDREWIWRALFLGYSLGFVSRPLYHYFCDYRRPLEQRAAFTSGWYAVLPDVFEDFVERATEPPALLSKQEARACRAEFYQTVGWGLWRVGIEDEAREYLRRSAQLSDARGWTGIRERIAAHDPRLHQRLVGWQARFGRCLGR